MVTKLGYIRITPNITQLGDIITTFGESQIPFLIRKSDVRESAYRLVGGCYVHSISNEDWVRANESEVRLY